MKKKEDDITPPSRHISRQFRATDVRHNIMHLLPPLIRQPTPSDPMPSQLQIPILLTLRHIVVQRPHILRRRPVAPGGDFTAVLGDFDTRFFRLHPVDVFDGGEVLGLHEGFDVAVVADAAEVFFGFLFEGPRSRVCWRGIFCRLCERAGRILSERKGKKGFDGFGKGFFSFGKRFFMGKVGENDDFRSAVGLACMLYEKLQ